MARAKLACDKSQNQEVRPCEYPQELIEMMKMYLSAHAEAAPFISSLKWDTADAWNENIGNALKPGKQQVEWLSDQGLVRSALARMEDSMLEAKLIEMTPCTTSSGSPDESADIGEKVLQAAREVRKGMVDCIYSKMLCLLGGFTQRGGKSSNDQDRDSVNSLSATKRTADKQFRSIWDKELLQLRHDAGGKRMLARLYMWREQLEGWVDNRVDIDKEMRNETSQDGDVNEKTVADHEEDKRMTELIRTLSENEQKCGRPACNAKFDGLVEEKGWCYGPQHAGPAASAKDNGVTVQVAAADAKDDDAVAVDGPKTLLLPRLNVEHCHSQGGNSVYMEGVDKLCMDKDHRNLTVKAGQEIASECRPVPTSRCAVQKIE